jgi:hypothetical protein
VNAHNVKLGLYCIAIVVALLAVIVSLANGGGFDGTAVVIALVAAALAAGEIRRGSGRATGAS